MNSKPLLQLLLISTSVLICLADDPPSAGPLPLLGINARDFGLAGDGRADDTAALQRALDSLQTPLQRDGVGSNKTLWLPAGRYRVTDTIRLNPPHSGIEVTGSGAPWTHLPTTAILYDGPPGRPVLLLRGVNQSTLRNLAIHGGGKARAAIEVQTVRGSAASGMSFHRLTLGHAEHGMLLGDDGVGHNSDCSSFYEIIFHDAKYGFRTVADQNMEYTFLRCGVANVGIRFWFEKGGDATFLHAGGYNARTFIKFDNPGVNNGNLTVIGLRFEHYRMRGVAIEAAGDAQVNVMGMCSTATGLFDDPTHGYKADWETPNFILHPGAHLRVSGSLLSGGVARITGDDSRPAWATFDDCRFKLSRDPRQDVKLTGKAGYELRNCRFENDMIHSFRRDQTGLKDRQERKDEP